MWGGGNEAHPVELLHTLLASIRKDTIVTKFCIRNCDILSKIGKNLEASKEADASCRNGLGSGDETGEDEGGGGQERLG